MAQNITSLLELKAHQDALPDEQKPVLSLDDLIYVVNGEGSDRVTIRLLWDSSSNFGDSTTSWYQMISPRAFLIMPSNKDQWPSQDRLVQITNYSKQQGDADLHDDYRESLQQYFNLIQANKFAIRQLNSQSKYF